MTAATSPKLIKRYANRKLYDTKSSCYVTLDEIAQMVQAGEDVKIVDNKTKEDMTAVTLAQIIFEQEKKTSRMPLSVLRGMIQSSGEVLSDLLQRTVASPVSNIKGEMERTFDKVFHRGEPDDPEHDSAVQGDEASDSEDRRNVLREFVNASGQALEEWQKRIDDQVQRALSTMTNLPTVGSEMQRLRDRIESLEKQLGEFENKDA